MEGKMNYETECCVCGSELDFEWEGRQAFLLFQDRYGNERKMCNDCLESLKIELQWE